jgi:hypothetical protein
MFSTPFRYSAGKPHGKRARRFLRNSTSERLDKKTDQNRERLLTALYFRSWILAVTQVKGRDRDKFFFFIALSSTFERPDLT